MQAMKLRLATIGAFLAGFLLGIVGSTDHISRVTGHDSGQRSTTPTGWITKTRAIVVLGTVRARDAIGMGLGWRDGEAATEAIIVEMTSDVASVINARAVAV